MMVVKTTLFLLFLYAFLVLVESPKVKKRLRQSRRQTVRADNNAASSTNATEQDPFERSVQDAQTYRIRFTKKLDCQKDFNCHPRAMLNLVLSVVGFYEYNTSKKIVVLSFGSSDYPGTGWFFALNLTEHEEPGVYHSNDWNPTIPSDWYDYTTHISPIVSSYQLSFNLTPVKEVQIIKNEPRNREDAKRLVRFENVFFTGVRHAIRGGISGEYSKGTKPVKEKNLFGRYTGKMVRPTTKSITPELGWGMSSVTKSTVVNVYAEVVNEYNAASIAETQYATSAYTRAPDDCGTIASKPVGQNHCRKHFRMDRFGPVAYAGFIPGLAATIQADEFYGGKQTITVVASATIIKKTFYQRYVPVIFLDAEYCDQDRCGESGSKTFESKKRLTIYWAHPTFSLVETLLIKLHSYRSKHVPNKQCMAAFLDTRPAKFVFLVECDHFDNRNLYAWIPDRLQRLQWFSKSLDRRYCLSSRLEYVKNLFVEPCVEGNPNQVWHLQNGIFKNAEGSVYVNREANLPVVMRDMGGRTPILWRQEPGPQIHVNEAFEYQDI